MTPIVSILIPVYNRVSLIGQTIETARNQTYQNIEIIIVDNCSTDGTWDLLKEYTQKDERIKVFQNEENIGPVRNWKRCIDEAQGEYSKILFSDDLISTNFIEETLKLFDDKSAFVLSLINVFRNDKTIRSINFDEKDNYSVETYINSVLLDNRYKFPVSPGASIFRTQDLKDSLEIEIKNPMNMDFSKFGAGNDLLIYLNIAINYETIKICPTAIAYFRSHKESFTISNKLTTYYEYSKFYFANKNIPQILPKMKGLFWLRKTRKNNDGTVYHLIQEKIDRLYILKQIVRKLFNPFFGAGSVS